MDDLLNEFLTETAENIETLDVELVNFEQNPNDKTILSNIFRLVHTIKGTCGFLGLPKLESLAHAGENVLGKIRDGSLEVTPEIVSLIFECLDKIKEILVFIEQNETEPAEDNLDLIANLNATAAGQPPKKQTSKKEEKDDSFPVAAELLQEVEIAYAQGKKAASEAEIKAEMQQERENSISAPSVISPQVPEEKNTVAVKDSSEISISNQSIRVHVDLLETLMNQVSELVLVRNQLLQKARTANTIDTDLSGSFQRLSLITSELQEGIMKTRMQPIGNAWAQLPRIVRDLAIETEKKLDLVMKGADTELDRQVLELIKDPLTHMVRNSADHGIESPEERKAAGKPEIGTITLNAFHEGGHIIVEIKDDGRGLNIEKIKEKVIMNNLATEGELSNLSDQQIGLFIFKAGFSTAEVVTSVSGRGVGMDVVRTNIDKIGGNIEVKTQPGKGSTFVIKIPLTLAIVSALIVSVCDEKFAIPQLSVLELVRVSSKSEQRVETINNSPVLRLRDRLLPLVDLSKLLNLDTKKINSDIDSSEPNDNFEEIEKFIVVSQVGSYTFGIMVDKVFDTEEIVVKPISPILRHITIFSGNTILGDGSVIMILDPNGIASSSGEIVSEKEQNIEIEDLDGPEKTSILIFRPNSTETMAVPLGLVARLEDIDVSSIEYSNGNPVVQYRNHLMPLLFIDGKNELFEQGSQPVLVFSDRDKNMGLVVNQILDIVEDSVQIEIKTSRPGVVGSAVISGKTTDIIDISYYLTQAFGDWFETHSSSQENEPNILFVDDSVFFRNLLAPILSASGFNIITAENALEALQLREKGIMFDVIISDIEMPKMTGVEFAKEVRAGGLWKDTPLIALSSHAKEEDIQIGIEAGFNEYVAKFDRDKLIHKISHLLASKEPVKMITN